ncbi:MAG TPA: S-adenosylmethionine:tRNA ribosyltransferase-isomerase, partial [Streptosporangiaceae bacterium]
SAGPGQPAEPGGDLVIRSATRPAEARGLTRDGVRLLAATPDGLVHTTFRDLPRFLAPGDLLVVNNSATLAAALPGRRAGGAAVTVHLSNQLANGTWLVELRQGPATARLSDGAPGEIISLPADGSVTLLHPYPDAPGPAREATRIWAAVLTTGTAGLHEYLARHGQPIRYSYVPDTWPLTAYQTVFARSPGSAEMPSAARPFTAELVTRLVAGGVAMAPVTLHTGVASLEAGEAPLPEWFDVPQPTADLVNLTRAAGRRVIAVGTTCTRALESAAAPDPVQGPTVTARRGWTGLVLGPEHPARVVNGLITGWHEPGASHLALLEAVAGPALVGASYREAEAAGYLWHEFGDSCLLLPPQPAGRPAARSPGERAVLSPPGRRAASA